MKFWLRYVLATIGGLVLGIIIPVYGGDSELFFEKIYSYIIHAGRYLVFPLLFFTIVVGVVELRENKRLFPVYGRMVGYTLVATILLALIGSLIIAIISPERIPIIIVDAEINLPPNFMSQILSIFPKNLFLIFVPSGDSLLPILVFATIFGMALFHNSSSSMRIIELSESISQVLHNMNRIMLEILSIGILFMSVYRIVQLKSTDGLELFSQFLLIVLFASLLIIFVLIPVFIFVLGGRRQNPYIWLFAILPATLSSLLSGDNYFTISPAVMVMHRNIEADRKITSTMISFGAIFSRSGIAMITCMSFILIMRSYSSLDITLFQYLRVIGGSVIISMMLATVPTNAMVISLAIISGWYAQGLEESFLILIPIAPILTSIAVLIDTVVMLCICQLAYEHEFGTGILNPRKFL